MRCYYRPRQEKKIFSVHYCVCWCWGHLHVMACMWRSEETSRNRFSLPPHGHQPWQQALLTDEPSLLPWTVIPGTKYLMKAAEGGKKGLFWLTVLGNAVHHGGERTKLLLSLLPHLENRTMDVGAQLAFSLFSHKMMLPTFGVGFPP